MTNRLRRADPVGRLLTDPEVATPAFVIDDAKLQVNLDFAKEKAARLGVTLRPHLKTHKSIEIARRQMLSPEGPATVSTLAEARYFAENGVKDLIYAVGIAPQKLADVAAIREAGCDLKIILDNVAAAKAVSAFCTKRGVTIPVLIEVDCDGHRSGVRPESELLIEIARALTDGAELAGVLTHAGASYDVENLAVIRRAAANERDGIVTAANRLREAGFEVRIVSIGSTPTMTHAEDETGVTEIRAGVYALGDLFMMNLGVVPMDRIAGTVLCTVIGHQPEKGQVIVDAGWMAMSRDRGTARQHCDFGYGLVCDVDGRPLRGCDIRMTGANQEHGIIEAAAGDRLKPEDLPVGTHLRIMPNHACPTLRTTNDMPIAEPPSFDTFGFIPFQTNPHFISAAGTSGLNNETREDRLEEFLWYNKDEEVIGLPEGTALFVTGEHDCEVIGPKDAEALYWFRQAEMGMRLERIALGTKFDLRKIVPGGKL